MIQALSLGALAAVALTALALAVTLPWLRRLGVIDIPVERSMHTTPVVRGAGLALLPGMLGGALVTEMLLSRNDGPLVTASSALYLTLGAITIVAFAAIGLSDDFFSHGVLSRLLIQAGVALVLAAAITVATAGQLFWVPPTAVVIVAGVNITNFMDGANGLLVLHGLVTALWFGGLAVSQQLWGPTSLAVGIAGALVAFAPVNTRGRAFLGDVGSYALGAAWVSLGLYLVGAGLPVEAAIAPVAVFIADFAYTLQLRVRAGDRWYQPHKLHIYQRLISAGWSHLASSGLTAALSAACCLLALPAALGAGPVARVLCAVLALTLLGGYVRLPVLMGAPVPWHDSRGRRARPKRTA